MSESSAIEWTDHTFNIVWGCNEASPGCDNCYARVHAHRYGFNVWGARAARRTFGERYWAEPIRWNAQAARAGRQAKVFCSSMTDIFLNDPTIDAEREKLWPLIRSTPHLIWQLLTKHPERIAPNLPADWGQGYANVWLGATVEDSDNTWRARVLRGIPAAVRFLSCEPLLGPLERLSLQGIDWVICGGESGPKARPMDVQWARALRDLCASSGIAFFLKQLGGRRDKRGGSAALLDGREHKAFPVEPTAA